MSNILNKLFYFSLFIISIFIIIIFISSIVSSCKDLSSNDVITNSSVTISGTCDNSYDDITKFTRIKCSNGMDIYIHNYTGVCYINTCYGVFNPLYNSDGTLLVYSN